MKVALKLQAPALEKLPALLVEKLTLPAGVIFVPPSVSLTVAVQVVGTFIGSEEGEQATPVDVVRLVAPTMVDPLLGACVESPL
jgi:hypothetical protein